MENKPKRFIAPLLGLAAILVVVAIYLMATMPSKDVDMPTTDASPEQVVAAYVEALDSHDCDTAEELTAASKSTSAARWCRNVSRLADVRVSDAISEASEFSDPSGLRSSSNQMASREVMYVPVTFDLRWRIFHFDSSMSEGPTSWGYRLERGSPNDPWRIFDEGNG